ncbi:MAG: galactokinase [Bacteroidia bacterium]|nr:galactokinase [Bacteroidia bacterium]
MPNSISIYSPGRVNIIGEHTDYNKGLVLPGAVDKSCKIDIVLSSNPQAFSIHSKNLNQIVEWNVVDPIPETQWCTAIFSLIRDMTLKHTNIKGVEITLDSNIPIGGGMSSSSAILCGVAHGLFAMFEIFIEPLAEVQYCQQIEEAFSGVRGGIMDQLACYFGKKDHVIFLDCGSLEFEYIPWKPIGYQLYLINTHVSHELANSEYNKRREECESALEILQQHIPELDSFSQLTLDQLAAHVFHLSAVQFKRCRHVITENQRVLDTIKAMEKDDFSKLGRHLNASHQSLRDDYEVSCPELDFLSDKLNAQRGIAGCRMMGGGFGGCTLVLAENASFTDFSLVASAYRKQFGIDLSVYEVSISDGLFACDTHRNG